MAVFTSCKKSSTSPPPPPFKLVTFTATEYKYLSTYDTIGRPTNLLKPDTLSEALSRFIENSLPAGHDVSKSNSSLLSSNSDLNITAKSDVYVTFVFEGASQLNTLGYYTYSTSSPPQKPADLKNITYMFPNASLSGWAGGGLVPGDKIKIGTFDAGTSIGFVLIEKGWDLLTKKVNSQGYHFFSNQILNPETDPNLKKHTVSLNFAQENKIFIGFEDMIRSEPSCDQDFNDIIIYATINPS